MSLLLVGPLGNGFAPPRDGRAPLLVGGGVGIAPLAIWQDELGRRDRSTLLRVPRRRATPPAPRSSHTPASPPTTAASATTASSPSCSRTSSTDRADDVEVYACGPPAMLEAVRAICSDREVPAQLALESGMACGFGACFGCVVPTVDGYVRLCVDGPGPG